MKSIWIKSSAQTIKFPVFKPALTEVIVIGGGIAGICNAYQLSKEGYKVVLIEARTIGCGTTGNNTGKLSSLQQLKYQSIEEKLGLEACRAYAGLNESGIDLIEEIVSRYQISCGFERCANYTFSFESNKKIKREMEAAKRAGLPVEWNDEIDLPFKISGAIKLNNQARFNPYLFCIQLASVLQKEGVMIFEKTRALNVKSKKGHHEVITEHGSLLATHVILATHLPFLDRSGHFTILKPSQSYGISATLLKDKFLPKGMYISDSEPIRSIQRSGSQLIIAGESSPMGKDSEKHYHALETFAKQHWPVKTVAYQKRLLFLRKTYKSR